MTVNGNELLATPPSVTVAEPGPGAAPLGTLAIIVPSLQLVIGAFAPLNTTFPDDVDW